jgi:hypothetical protein
LHTLAITKKKIAPTVFKHRTKPWYSNRYQACIDFITKIAANQTILITIGNIALSLIEKLKTHFFEKKGRRIYTKQCGRHMACFVDQLDFTDLIPLLHQAK